MSKFWLILDKAQIHKNRDFLGAEVKFYSFASDNNFSLPQLDQLTQTHDVSERRAIVRSAAQAVLGAWEGVQVDHIRSNHVFEFGDTGRVLYSANEIPNEFHWIMFVIDVDSDVRDLGARIDELLPDEKVDSIASNLLKIAGATATPQISAALSLSKTLIRGITSYFKHDDNDQLGVIEQSFIRPLHYPTGKRSSVGNSDLSGNMYYDYTIFGINE